MSYYNEQDPGPIRGLVWMLITVIIVTFLWVLAIAYGEDHMTPEKQVLKLLKIEEGFRSHIYSDQLGYPTIGFGHNTAGRSLTIEEQKRLFPGSKVPMSNVETVHKWRNLDLSEPDAIYLLENDIHIAENDAKKIYGDQEWSDFPDHIKVSILDLSFNLGYKYRKFKKHIAAIKDGDWNEAAKQIENSLAAIQAPNRYRKIAKRIRGE